MNVILKHETLSKIEQEILQHPAWLGHISGLIAEKFLETRKIPYLYVLRAGEYELEYYATFLHADLTVRHQPFVITLSPEGWYYENGEGSCLYKDASISDVIHLIMHCEKDECVPLANFGMTCL